MNPINLYVSKQACIQYCLFLREHPFSEMDGWDGWDAWDGWHGWDG